MYFKFKLGLNMVLFPELCCENVIRPYMKL